MSDETSIFTLAEKLRDDEELTVTRGVRAYGEGIRIGVRSLDRDPNRTAYLALQSKAMHMATSAKAIDALLAHEFDAMLAASRDPTPLCEHCDGVGQVKGKGDLPWIMCPGCEGRGKPRKR